jgi:hypothetical protein
MEEIQHQKYSKFLKMFRGSFLKRIIDSYKDDEGLKKITHFLYDVTIGLIDPEEDRIGTYTYRTLNNAVRISQQSGLAKTEDDAKKVLEEMVSLPEEIIIYRSALKERGFRLEEDTGFRGERRYKLTMLCHPMGVDESCC